MAINGTNDLNAFYQTNMMIRPDNDNRRPDSQSATSSQANNADRVTLSREAKEMSGEGIKPSRPEQSAINSQARAVTYSESAKLTGTMERTVRR